MDAPLTKGPQMRWQRKLNESCNNSARNDSALNFSHHLNASTSKTPLKMTNSSNSNILGQKATGSKTPKKTPSNTPGKFL